MSIFNKIFKSYSEKEVKRIMPLVQKINDLEEETSKLSDSELKFVAKAIESHMGPWNTDYNGNEILPKPKTKYESFVHMCDYLASRKYLNIEFDNNNDIIL